MMSFNNKLRQVIFLIIIIVLGIVLLSQLTGFMPGLLGGITLYILSRERYFKLIHKRKWKKKGLTAFLFILFYIVVIAIPFFFAIKLISPRINALISNQQEIMNGLKLFSDNIARHTGMELFTPDKLQSVAAQVTSFIPSLINSTASLITNLIMMFFLFYYLLVSGKEIEKYLSDFIPLKKESVTTLAKETRVLIKANALGIPIISVVQGIFAALGYWIFGVSDWGMWGFLTGVFAFFPIIGTMIIWVPLVIFLYTSGQTWPATGLLIYSVVVTGNVDYITRLLLLKKMGDVHPVITVFGVIVGLGLFGFVGLIFGPLLVSYFVIFSKIYINEFSNTADEKEE